MREANSSSRGAKLIEDSCHFVCQNRGIPQSHSIRGNTALIKKELFDIKLKLAKERTFRKTGKPIEECPRSYILQENALEFKPQLPTKDDLSPTKKAQARVLLKKYKMGRPSVTRPNDESVWEQEQHLASVTETGGDPLIASVEGYDNPSLITPQLQLDTNT